jgi:hypothetical protein
VAEREVNDGTFIRVIDLDEKGAPEIWRGNLWQFEETNANAAEWLVAGKETDLRTELREHGFAVIGGGAAAAARIEIIRGYRVLILTPSGSRSITFADDTSACRYAGLTVSIAPCLIAATVTDLDHGDLIWSSTPMTSLHLRRRSVAA